MSPHRYCSFLVLLVVNILFIVYGDGVNLTVTDLVGQGDENPPSSSSPPAAAVNLPVFKQAMNSLSILSSFPEDLEISDYCMELLHIFGQRYVAYVNCLVPAARPVKVCQKCFSAYGSLTDVYKNISSDQGASGSEGCSESLLRSDRLMLVYMLYSNLQGLWDKAHCEKCIEGFQSLTNDTLYFMNSLNLTLTCFEKYQQGNHSELCKSCKSPYRELNELYSRMEKNSTLCIDTEDAMNITRRLWSKNFNCSFPRAETVPVIAVSSFMLFLPIIFYLSSFLHSEQKKRKLIHPKRAKSYSSLMNIQDKLS